MQQYLHYSLKRSHFHQGKKKSQRSGLKKKNPLQILTRKTRVLSIASRGGYKCGGEEGKLQLKKGSSCKW